ASGSAGSRAVGTGGAAASSGGAGAGGGRRWRPGSALGRGGAGGASVGTPAGGSAGSGRANAGSPWVVTGKACTITPNPTMQLAYPSTSLTGRCRSERWLREVGSTFVAAGGRVASLSPIHSTSLGREAQSPGGTRTWHVRSE